MDKLELNFEEISKLWIKGKSKGLKETSVDRYETIIQRHLIPKFGDNKISNITNVNVKEYINELKGKFKFNTYKAIILVLKDILSFAYDDKFENDKVFKKMLSVKYTPDYNILNINEIKALIKYLLNGDIDKNLGIIIALSTGLRLGEVCALKWKNIDFNSRSLLVEKNMQRVKNKNSNESKTILKLIDPKSSSSIRKVPLTKTINRILKLKFKKLKPDKEDYVLAYDDKKFMNPRTLERTFDKQCMLAIGKKIKFHELRHTFATITITNQIDVKTLSKILGHSDISITLQIYANIKFDDKLNAIDRFEDIIET